MATDKKGFILYADQKELFDQLPNDKAGELIKHIFSYVNDESPSTDDLLIKLAFTPIKQQLKRDLKKFEDTKLQRSNAGKRSAELRKVQRDSTPLDSVQRSSTKATVTVNDNVTVNDKDINKEVFDKFWNYYDKKRNKDKAEKIFIKLSEEDLEQIRITLPQYLDSTPDKQFRKDPDVYLRNKCWNDEIITKQQTQLNTGGRL